MSNLRDFWRSPADHTTVKSNILVEYFVAWAHVVRRSCNTLTYLDLCSGRGLYEDNSKATPLLLLDAVARNPWMHGSLKIHFYEKNRVNREILIASLREHEVFRLLTEKPAVHSDTVSRELVESIPQSDCMLTFIDPYGYKGISLDLLSYVARGWGSDCLFYLSISGIRRNLLQFKQQGDLMDLFGQIGYDKLKRAADERQPTKPFHKLVISELRRAVGAMDKFKESYVLPFVVQHQKNSGVSHLIVFLSKHVKGFEIMKDVMAKFSHRDHEGFPNFVYDDLRYHEMGLSLGRDELVRELWRMYYGKTATVGEVVVECHKRSMLATTSNIKHTIRHLVELDHVSLVDPEGRKLRAGTLPDRLTLTFHGSNK